MAIIQCRECGKEVSSEAVACPNCGAPPPPKAAVGTPKKVSGKTVAYIALAVFVGLAVLGKFVGPQPSKPLPAEESAWYACESFIQKNLRDPSSADFISDYDPTFVVPAANGDYTVTMKVRAANGFGGKTVSIFNCKAHHSGENWNLIDLHEIR